MPQKPKPNERLVRARVMTFRTPSGTPLPPVPQYKIVNADEADPDSVVELKENEWLVWAGSEFNDLALARERYAAKKAGKEIPPREEGTRLYIIETDVNTKTKLSTSESIGLTVLRNGIIRVGVNDNASTQKQP